MCQNLAAKVKKIFNFSEKSPILAGFKEKRHGKCTQIWQRSLICKNMKFWNLPDGHIHKTAKKWAIGILIFDWFRSNLPIGILIFDGFRQICQTLMQKYARNWANILLVLHKSWWKYAEIRPISGKCFNFARNRPDVTMRAQIFARNRSKIWK